jgi:arsenate reductase
MITIYHNNKCSKSRTALGVLENSGKEFEVVNYLQDTPSVEELTAIVKKLGITAKDLVRKTESVYTEKYKGKDLSEEEWISAMVENPILIERPIVVSGDKAVIGRPTENIYTVLSDQD